MKKSIYKFSVIILFFSVLTMACDDPDPGQVCEEKTWNGDLTITTKAALKTLSGYSSINGSLEITGADIEDLEGLECLSSIEGSLKITDKRTCIVPAPNPIDDCLKYEYEYNVNLRSLNGLNGLKSVDGDLVLRNNPVLKNFESLSSLTIIGGDFRLEDGFYDLSGFRNLEKAGGCLHFNAVELEYPDALEKLSFIGSDLILENTSLVGVYGMLGSINTIIGKINIINNNSLLNLDNFCSGLSSVPVGGILITNNDLLTNINGLNKINTNGDIIISNNPSLLDIEGLIGVAGNIKMLYIDNNYSLVDINGLRNISATEGYILQISNNVSLGNLDGLYNLTYHRGDLEIIDNSSLENVDGLANIISGRITSLEIIGNIVLPTCNAIHLKDILVMNGTLNVFPDGQNIVITGNNDSAICD